MMTLGESDPLSRPYLRLVVRGGFGREQTLNVRMDTGFDLTLALPHSVIAALGLEYVGERYLIAATNEKEAFSEYRACVLWNGFERPIRVLAKPGDALAGVALFHGCRVCIEFIDGGVELAEIVSASGRDAPRRRQIYFALSGVTVRVTKSLPDSSRISCLP